MENQRTQDSQIILHNKGTSGGITIPEFKLYYRATVLNTKLKFKWIKDLNIKSTTLNLLEEKVGSTLEHIGIGDHFLNITRVA